MSRIARRGRGTFAAALVSLIASTIAGCAAAPPPPPTSAKPSVAPTSQPSASLDVRGGDVAPMYRELLAIDLETVLRVATADNLDIRQARERVEASRGRYESSVGAIFPVIVPSAAFQHFEGHNQNANGTLVATSFNDFLPAISIQWILNPAKVAYDIIAARRRLEASEHQEQAIVLDTVRSASLQYYDLVLAQAQLGVARQSVGEAEELLRITRLKVKAGTGLPTDELRADASLQGLRQDVTLALNRFYQASVALTLTLHLDPTVTLVPSVGPIRQTTLVREDLPVDRLLAIAGTYRPDLAAVRSLLGAFQADTGDALWGGLGPQVQAGYTYGGIQADAPGQQTGLHEQQKAGVGASFALGVSTFGQVKTARANERAAAVDLQRQADRIRAAVVSAQQASLTHAALVPVAQRQLEAAEQALKLAQANLRAGTLLTVDVLQTQNEADRARLRYVEAVVRYNQSQIDLLAAMGILEGATDVVINSQHHSPTPAAVQ